LRTPCALSTERSWPNSGLIPRSEPKREFGSIHFAFHLLPRICSMMRTRWNDSPRIRFSPDTLPPVPQIQPACLNASLMASACQVGRASTRWPVRLCDPNGPDAVEVGRYRPARGSPASAVQEFRLSTDLHFHAPGAMLAEPAIELAARFTGQPRGVYSAPPGRGTFRSSG
jgi:hypothetical protein